MSAHILDRNVIFFAQILDQRHQRIHLGRTGTGVIIGDRLDLVVGVTIGATDGVMTQVIAGNISPGMELVVE